MNIESLIKSLERAENDNKKFALLLILSELFKSKKLDESIKTDKRLNERLFKSIGAHFLARLLASKQLVENSPILYKSVSLSILTQFLDYAELITEPVLLTKIDCVFDVIKGDLEQEPGGVCLKLDAFKYIYALSKICPDFLYQNGLVSILINQVILNEKFSDLKTIKVIYDFDEPAENENFAIIACKILSNLIKDIIETKLADDNFALSKTNEKIEESFRNFLEITSKSQSQFKFSLINYLNFFLSDEKSIQKYLIFDQNLNYLTSKLVFEIINDLFKSRIKESIIELAFVLLNNFVKMFDFESIYLKNRNFFYLLIHLLCIQIGLNLQQNGSNENIINKMSIYYSLLEQVIIILSTASPFDTGDEQEDEEDQDDTDEDVDSDVELEQSKKGSKRKESDDNYEPEFKKCIKVVVEVLQSILLYIKDTLVSHEDFNGLDDNTKVLVVSSVRILVCWMSHESLLEEDIMELMPRILKFTEHLEKSKLKLNAFKFIAPGLSRVLNDKKNKLDFKLKKLKSKNDLVKIEFEKSELCQEIENIQSMLDKCLAK